MLTDKLRIANALNEYFCSAFTSDDGKIPRISVLDATPPISSLDINEAGVLSLLLGIDVKKSPGVDEIPNAFLRRYAEWWKAAYTYVLHTVCYSMDFDLAADLRETAFAECPEPWKYTLTMTVNAGRDPMGNQVIMATVHDSGSFSGGLPRTITMTATHRYVISAKQTDVLTLPPPYETACIDYHRLNDTKTRTGFSKTQDKECEDTCIQHVWEKLCGCVSANYMLRHTIDAPVCSTVERYETTRPFGIGDSRVRPAA
ncbi:uncharacterized protein LOC142790265 [Rhipicephalus microplus]|uniref:uncharacterized protein LOC142790265 n=1 Tax=Rhipicephalus microplus TaxID=6941 RepID=UPI003F6D68CB